MKKPSDKSWPKHLSVDKKLILLLSASTYESFPRALRELVSNAYDADATRVNISISLEEKKIEIYDNGSGMTPDEFGFFLRIAGNKKDRPRKTPLGRKRIGQFGVGFLAMFPFCETVEIESTVAGSPVVFRATIPASKFCTPEAQQEELTDTNVDGVEFSDEKQRNEHYTRFKLTKTSRLLTKYLTHNFDQKKYKKSIRSFPGMDRLKWELQDILPITIPEKSVLFDSMETKGRNFDVYLNDKKLEANNYLTEVLDRSQGYEQVGKIKFTYAIGTPWKAVSPDEARGLRIRLNHVGIGPRQYFELGVSGRTFSRLHWLTGEVNIVEGLDEAVALDRESFTASQDYEDFREFFREKLRFQAFHVEEVDEAKRKIQAQINQSPRAAIAPKSEVVHEQIKRLEKRGFTVIHQNDSSKPSINLDTKKRTATISNVSNDLGDRLVVAGKEWSVEYTRWPIGSNRHDACRFEKGGKLQINRDYPLFNGANKDLFRKFMIIIAAAEAEAMSKDEMVDLIQKFMIREFGS